MDELLDIYDDIASGDVERARRRLEKARAAGADPDVLADLEAFLDAEPGPAHDGPAMQTDLTHPGFVMPARRDAIPFACIVCGHEEHFVRQVLLNRRWTSLLAWDAIDRSARTYGCGACGHIAWFGPAAPGAFQSDVPQGDAVCRCCGHDVLRRSTALLNARGWTLLGLEAFNQRAQTDLCVRCGHIHWSVAGTPWQRPAPSSRTGCLACGGEHLTARPLLLNQRATTFLGLDWLDAGADCVTCQDCGALRWQARA